MPIPNDAPIFPVGVTLTKLAGAAELSPSFIAQLVTARQSYDWPAGTGAAVSQQVIIDLELFLRARLAALNPATAHEIVIEVSRWAGNNANSHAQIVTAPPAQQAMMQGAIHNLLSTTTACTGISQLCGLAGVSLVIASKIYRFCAPTVGAAVDRHASYYFNSLPVVGHGHGTAFLREWANGSHTSSRLAIYSARGLSLNQGEYFNTYLPLLTCIVDALNAQPAMYCCAATIILKSWTPADVEMAAYYWWACNGAR